MSELAVRKIYAFALTDANMATALHERFSRITPQYILTFSEEEPDGGYEICGEDMRHLSDADNGWLASCLYVIAKEHAEEHAAEIEVQQQNFLAEFESELKKQQEIENKRKGNNVAETANS